MKQKSKNISRYTIPSGAEAEYEPGSRGHVLQNLKGITHKIDMDQLEFETLVQVQSAYLAKIESDTVFTAELIRKMHKDWLGGLYEWAGEYRRVELAKSDFTWPPAYLIEKNMNEFERNILKKKTPCRPGPINRIAMEVAEVHAELLLIHPFREGNGRLARWLAELMVLQTGLPLPIYGFTGRGSTAERKRYLNGVQRGYVRDYRCLADFFVDAIKRGEE